MPTRLLLQAHLHDEPVVDVVRSTRTSHAGPAPHPHDWYRREPKRREARLEVVHAPRAVVPRGHRLDPHD